MTSSSTFSSVGRTSSLSVSMTARMSHSPVMMWTSLTSGSLFNLSATSLSRPGSVLISTKAFCGFNDLRLRTLLI